MVFWKKTTSSLLFGEHTLLLQHCSATPCHLSFLWTWFWSSNTDFWLTWNTWPLSCFHPWSAWMIWTGLWWIWADNNAGIVTVHREAARTLTLKDWTGSFSLIAEGTEVFYNVIWEASCWKPCISSWRQKWCPCFCLSILHALHTVCLALNSVHFLPASIPLYYTYAYEEKSFIIRLTVLTLFRNSMK